MVRNIFTSLAEYLRASQQEWMSRSAPQEEDSEAIFRSAYHLGEQRLADGEYEQAIPLFKKATSSRQYKKDAYYSLAECYRQLKMIPLARKTYERLMRLDYHFRDIQEKLHQLDGQGPGSRNVPQATPTGVVSGQVTQILPSEDRYDILQTIYEGPHSRIYQVQDKLLGRIIALKQIDKSLPDRAAYLRQMKERTALDHSNILRIYDIDEKQGHIAMEYVQGRNLREILRMKGTLALDIAMYIAIQLVNGLHHAHSRNIIHHALMPEHLLLTKQCHLKITAFRTPHTFTRKNKTLHAFYTPPEILRHDKLTIASNIYSFGIMVYEMVSGRMPFSVEQLKAAVHNDRSLSFDGTLLPSGLAEILQRCITVDPAQRENAIRTVGESLIHWYDRQQYSSALEEHVNTYKDFLMMIWADGKITEEEAVFLTHKQQELHISDDVAGQAEVEVKQELQQLIQKT